MYTTLYEKYLWPRLKLMDPENAHDLVTDKLEKISRSRLLCLAIALLLKVEDKRLERKCMGITFPNPVGLAAGFSKYGIGLPALETLGFGFLELGGITPLPQDGKPKPRMFRLEEDRALINRMGFNNPGAHTLRNTLRNTRRIRSPIAINLGKGIDTPVERAAEDYCDGLKILYEEADFFVINVSSPNTPGLRTLQDPEALNPLLREINFTRNQIVGRANLEIKPILVKIAPDIEDDKLEPIIECVMINSMQGLVLTNTTMKREGLVSENQREVGGLSGKPLRDRALTLVNKTKELAPFLTVIGVGGIFTGEDAWNMMVQAGADLVQVYTGLVYKGPGLVRRINKELLQYLDTLVPALKR